MKLEEIYDLVPAGVLDHVRVYYNERRIKYPADNHMKCEVVTIAPSLHCESSMCKCIYDGYIDVYIQEQNENPFT